MSKSISRRDEGLFQCKLLLVVSLLSFGDMAEDVDRLDDFELLLSVVSVEAGTEESIRGASKFAKIFELAFTSDCS